MPLPWAAEFMGWKFDFLCSKKFETIEPKKRGSMNNFDFFKFVISTRGRCDYSPKLPKNLPTPLFTALSLPQC
jgi:hypothetical protein